MTAWLFSAVACSAGAAFLVGWVAGDWLTSWRRIWLPGPPGPGVIHGEHVRFRIEDGIWSLIPPSVGEYVPYTYPGSPGDFSGVYRVDTSTVLSDEGVTSP